MNNYTEQYTLLDEEEYELVDVETCDGVVKGGYYKTEWGNQWAIGKILEVGLEQNQDMSWIHRSAHIYNNGEKMIFKNPATLCLKGKERGFRGATQDEINWLERCIAAGRLVAQEAKPLIEEKPVGIISSDELRNEAMRKYPVGSYFFPTHLCDSKDVICGVYDYNSLRVHSNGQIDLYGCNSRNNHVFTGMLRDNTGRWAKPATKEEFMEALYKEAAKKYPRGTKLKTIEKGNVYTSTGQVRKGLHSDGSVSMYVETNSNGMESATCFTNGKWADVTYEAINEKYVPEPGEWVIIKDTKSTDSRNKVGKAIKVVTTGATSREKDYITHYEFEGKERRSDGGIWFTDVRKAENWEIPTTYYTEKHLVAKIPYVDHVALLSPNKEKGFDEQEWLSRPFNQQLTVNIKQKSNKKVNLQL